MKLQNLIHILMGIICIGLLPKAQAVSPPPPGGYPNFTTAAGQNALLSLTLGVGNTALGTNSLLTVTTGNNNTAVGVDALLLNTADNNTATGALALLLNTTGTNNTANGALALELNDTGDFNDAVGAFALFSNIDGSSNNAFGDEALFSNITSILNTAVGDLALEFADSDGAGSANFNTAVGAGALAGDPDVGNMSGDSNNAVGVSALGLNTTGLFNQAVGAFALNGNSTGASNIAIGDSAAQNNGTGSFNTVIGDFAGQDLSAGTDNIYIGSTAGNGAGDESGTIRVGDPGFVGACFIAGIFGETASGGTQVFINGNGQLGTSTSSARFKDDIKPMEKASEALLALKPVTFRYKKEIDPKGIPQFGLVAEEVEKVNPALVIHDPEGRPTLCATNRSTRCCSTSSSKNTESRGTAGDHCRAKLTVAQQQKGMEVLTAQLKSRPRKSKRSTPSLKRANLRRKWSTIPKQQHFTISRHASPRGGFLFYASLCLFEIARVLVRFDYVASFIVNANHSIM